jgi:Uma2 family endonuclease
MTRARLDHTRADVPGLDYTAEEAFWLNPSGVWELVDGRFVFMSPAGARHGSLVARVSRALADFVEPRGLGIVLAGDVGFVLRRKPDAVRAPDVAFLRADRASTLPTGFVEGAPDLAVEIMSPGDRATEVERKAREFVGAGSTAVWVIDPDEKTCRVYAANGSNVLAGDAALACPELLGAFALRLSDLWS